jgi:hypothetical protein
MSTYIALDRGFKALNKMVEIAGENLAENCMVRCRCYIPTIIYKAKESFERVYPGSRYPAGLIAGVQLRGAVPYR